MNHIPPCITPALPSTPEATQPRAVTYYGATERVGDLKHHKLEFLPAPKDEGASILIAFCYYLKRNDTYTSSPGADLKKFNFSQPTARK